MASGRTDLGVHARMQVLSMRVPRGTDLAHFTQAVNAQLTLPVGLGLTVPASPKFSAGFASVAKEYRYRLLGPGHDPRWSPFGWDVEVDLARLQQALALFPGARTFVAFQRSAGPLRVRTITHASVHAHANGVLDVHLRGDAFGKYMVRYLVASAVQHAQGRLPLEAIDRALETGSFPEGTERLEKAPAQGLVLWDVAYPPALDPFSREQREAAPVPDGPPFSSP